MIGRVPVLAVVTHLTLIDTDRLAAIVTVLGEHGVKAAQTIRFSVSHNVPREREKKNILFRFIDSKKKSMMRVYYTFDRPAACRTRNKQSASCARLVPRPPYTRRPK